MDLTHYIRPVASKTTEKQNDPGSQQLDELSGDAVRLLALLSPKLRLPRLPIAFPHIVNRLGLRMAQALRIRALHGRAAARFTRQPSRFSSGNCRGADGVARALPDQVASEKERPVVYRARSLVKPVALLLCRSPTVLVDFVDDAWGADLSPFLGVRSNITLNWLRSQPTSAAARLARQCGLHAVQQLETTAMREPSRSWENHLSVSCRL